MRLKTLASVILLSYPIYATAALETEADKLSYSLGATLAEQLRQFEGLNSDALTQGLKDALAHQPLKMTSSEMKGYIQEAKAKKAHAQQAKLHEEAQKNLDKSMAFLAENSKKPRVVALQSGLQYKILSEGKGPKPRDNDEVVVHYEGRLMDGTVFDSSWLRNQPATFQLNRVIKGWTEGLQQMPKGSVWEFFIPASLAYGEGGVPGRIGPNETLIFKVELKEVNKNS